MKNKVILTYGTFDMYHEGHRKVIKDSKKNGYKLFVGVASDEYVKRKNKISLMNYEMRKKMLESDPLVDFVFPEESLDQWRTDLEKYESTLIRISEEHDDEISANPLTSDLPIEYFVRTPGISTTIIKRNLYEKNVVITYGTFDLLHEGHENIFKKAKEEGDILIVGVSTDEFNQEKGKRAHQNFAKRMSNVRNNPYVDFVIPEMTWDQKINDFKMLCIDTLVMGRDWEGKFDGIASEIKVKIFDRTKGISSADLRKKIEEDLK